MLQVGNKPRTKLVGGFLGEVATSLALLGVATHAHHAHITVTTSVLVRHAVARGSKRRAVLGTRRASGHGMAAAVVVVRLGSVDGASVGLGRRLTLHSLAGSVLVSIVGVARALHARRRRKAVDGSVALAVSKLGRDRRYTVVYGGLAPPAVVGGGRSLRMGRDVTRGRALGAGVEARDLMRTKRVLFLLV